MEEFIPSLIRHVLFSLLEYVPFMTGEALRWAVSGGRRKPRWRCLWDIREEPGLFDPSIWLGLAMWILLVWFLASR